jgi:hypothetical protein
MAFAKGRAFVILNRMAESGNSEAKKILGNLNSMSQEDLDSKLSTLFGKGGTSKEGDTAPKDEKGGKAPEGKEEAPKGKETSKLDKNGDLPKEVQEQKYGKKYVREFDEATEYKENLNKERKESLKEKGVFVDDKEFEEASKEMTSAKEGIKPVESDAPKKTSIEMLKEWADNKWEGQNDAGEIDAMYDEWKKTGTHPDNKTLGSQLSFNDYIKLEAEKFKNDPFNKAFGKRLEEMANEYDKLTGENAPKNTAMDNFKKGMEDRKQEREGVAPSKMTDAPNDETRLKQLNDDMGLFFENKFNVQKSKDGKGYDITKDGQVVKTVFSLDNVKSLMDRDLDRIYGGNEQGVAPTQNTDAFGTSKEMGGGIGGGQKDLLGKKADMADPNREDLRKEMETEIEDYLTQTGQDEEAIGEAIQELKQKYMGDTQRYAALDRLDIERTGYESTPEGGAKAVEKLRAEAAEKAKGSASNPMTSAIEGIKPVDDGKPDTKRQTQAKLSQEISGLMNLGDKSGKDAMKELFETKYANDEKMKDALIQLFAEEKVYKSKRTYGTNSFVKYKDAEGLTQNYKENVARLKQELAQKPNDFDTLAELRKVEMQYQKSLKLINK